MGIIADAGYTTSMKTAISVPDHIFGRAERLARRSGRSRSELYSTAMAEFLARHEIDEVTAAIDRVVESVGKENDDFLSEAASRILRDTEW